MIETCHTAGIGSKAIKLRPISVVKGAKLPFKFLRDAAVAAILNLNLNTASGGFKFLTQLLLCRPLAPGYVT